MADEQKLDDDRILSEDELAARYGHKSRATVRKWRQNDYGPAWTRLGRKVFYRMPDVLEWEKKRVSKVGAA